jgi:hypothetical protein
MVGNKGISIWFFIGTLLLIYGVIITGANLYEAAAPSMDRQIILKEINFGIWWGILLVIIGSVYFFHFRPWKNKKQN